MTPAARARLGRMADFLGLRRSTVGLLALAVLLGLGERMAERFLPIYLLALGGGPMVVGLLQAMDNLLSALYAFPGGYLAERFGARRALALFTLVAMAGYLVVIVVPSWPAVLLGATLFISWSAVSLPATMRLMYQVLPEGKRTMGVTLHSLVRRIPMALGPLAGGLCIAWWGERDGVRLAFGVALILALAALALQQVLLREVPEPDRTAAAPPEKNPFRLWPRLGPELRGLLVSDILLRFCEQIPYAFVVVWCMKVIDNPVSAPLFGLLTSLEMAVAVVIGIPVAWLADRGEKKPLVLITFVFFTMFPLVLSFSHSLPWLLLAFVVRGLKEFGEPTRKALIMDLAPADCRTAVFGLYYLIRDLFVSLAAILGAVLWQVSPALNLWSAFAFGLTATLYFARWGGASCLIRKSRLLVD